MDVTVVVATYGDDHWRDLAHQRAIPSAHLTGANVVYVHGDTLHEARNEGLARATTEWVAVLDADDELRGDYFEHMARGTCDVRAPAVQYIVRGRPRRPYVPQVAGHDHRCVADCLPHGNWLVIGSVVRTELARQVGGFRDFPWSEDWDLWLRLHLAGATFEAIPEAVYRAHVRPDSRNRAPDQAAKLAAHVAIHQANFPHLYTETA